VGKKKPDKLALYAGHALVGIAAVALTAKIAKAAGPGIFLGVVAIICHYELDAPVSQALSDAGL
jgi:hypothetical protein